MGINRVTVKSYVDIKAVMTALTFAPDAKVGYPEETTGRVVHEDSDLTMAELAAIQELGEGNIPPRPFMRQGAAIMEDRRGLLVVPVKRLVTGKTHAGRFMATMGLMLKSSIEAAVKRQNFTPLSPVTVAAKGSAEILIDSGEMVDNLDVHLDTL